MTTDPKQLVLAAFVELLRKVDEGDIADLDYGICNNIDNMLWRDRTNDDAYTKVWEFFDKVTEEIWPRWPKHSGSSSYPIPGSADVYWSLRGRSHWKGKQGQLRRELLQFTIEQLSKEQDQ
jgi:hypothetical protein